MAANIEIDGILLWAYFTQTGIQEDPSAYSTGDVKKVSIATTAARTEKFISEVASEVLPEWYANMSSLSVGKADLDRASRELSDLLKDPDPKKIHESLLAIQHLPTSAEERPLTRAGNPTAASAVADAWPTTPFVLSATAPAISGATRDPLGNQTGGTFRDIPTSIYVDDEVLDNFPHQLKPNLKKDSWMKLSDAFISPDEWIAEYSWGWRVTLLCGFKISNTKSAGLRIGFYPNKISFHQKAADYPARGDAGPSSGRQVGDL